METESPSREPARIIHLRQGMGLRIADFSPSETVDATFESANPMLRFYFHIVASGYWELRSRYGNTSETKIPHRDRFSLAFFYPELEGKMHWPADGRQSHVSITITPPLLESYLGACVEGFPETLRAISEGCSDKGFAHDGPLSPHMDLAIRQLLDCPYTGAMKQLYMESKAIELIAHKLAQIQSLDRPTPASLKLHPDEVERIRRAGEILGRDLESPPKLLDLARAVGTNHSALNRGFRAIYGATVFGLLRQMRLQEAKRLLEEEGANVTETALTVGYSSIPSFSKAFSEFFGQNPATCLKKKL
jgi:AraC family transcriptional regulator, transcriptional activator of the genes for pyochelin and ferripyochelin receptors